MWGIYIGCNPSRLRSSPQTGSQRASALASRIAPVARARPVPVHRTAVVARLPATRTAALPGGAMAALLERMAARRVRYAVGVRVAHPSESTSARPL